MAYIRVLNSGKYQATVRRNGINKFKTFTTKKDANSWATKLDKHIKLIPTLTDTQILSLSDVDIELMGGADLFKKLGVDLFKVKHAAQLEAINLLSKKELPLLTAQQIESMGGVELFEHAGKGSRIRYKTFNEVCDEYFIDWSKTHKDIKNQLSRVKLWCDIFGKRIITDIDLFDIREQIDLMILDGQRLVTVSRKKAVLSSIFKYALSRAYIDRNIVRDVVVGNDSKTRKRVLSSEERYKLLEACQQSSWNKLYLLVLMGLFTGARKSELLELRWQDIDFKLSKTILSKTAGLDDTKNTDSKVLVFPSIVMNELKRFHSGDIGLIFESERKAGVPFDFKKVWAVALKKAGIKDKDTPEEEKFTFHSLRHGFCSALSDGGKELSDIAEMAGHKSVQTTMRYIHQSVDRKQQIMDELEETFNL